MLILQFQVYDAFARDVVDEQARKGRFKKVGFWSLQLAAQAIFMGMAGNIAWPCNYISPLLVMILLTAS